MGLFDGIKIMGDLIGGGIAAAKAGFKLDGLVERTVNEFGNKRTDMDKKLYDEYASLLTQRDNETDQEKQNELTGEVELAEVAYLNSIRKNPTMPETFCAEITLAIDEFKKANNQAMEKTKERMLKVCETEEERQAVLKAFEEDKMK